MSSLTPRDAFAFTVPLPPFLDQYMQRWAAQSPGATWDDAGGHITIARMAGVATTESVIAALQTACARLAPFPVRLSHPVREAYWDKPGLEIVMLTGLDPADTAGVHTVRARLLEALTPLGIELEESGRYRPHLTLTTGASAPDAIQLEALAADIELSFQATEVHFWTENTANPERGWYLAHRQPLGGPGT